MLYKLLPLYYIDKIQLEDFSAEAYHDTYR